MKILILLSFIIACIEACWWKKEEPARPVQRRPVPARLPPVKTKMGKIIRLQQNYEYIEFYIFRFLFLSLLVMILVPAKCIILTFFAQNCELANNISNTS